MGCHALLQRNLPDPGIEPKSPTSPTLAGGFFTAVPPGKLQYIYIYIDLDMSIYMHLVVPTHTPLPHQNLFSAPRTQQPPASCDNHVGSSWTSSSPRRPFDTRQLSSAYQSIANQPAHLHKDCTEWRAGSWAPSLSPAGSVLPLPTGPHPLQIPGYTDPR